MCFLVLKSRGFSVLKKEGLAVPKRVTIRACLFWFASLSLQTEMASVGLGLRAITCDLMVNLSYPLGINYSSMAAFVSVSRGASQIRTVARGWAVWAMVHPVFLCFIGKICKILQSRHFLCCLAHLVSKCYLQLCKWIFVSKCLLCFWKMGKVNDP